MRFVPQTESRQTEQTGGRLLRRAPPLKRHPTRTRHREQATVPRRLRGVGGQGVVGAVIGNEFLQVGEEGHWVTALLPREFVGINHAQPSLK